MKILITGGAGFIGSHIAEALAKGNDVVVLDDFSTGKRENLPPQVRVMTLSVTDHDAVREVFSVEQPDVVVHCAAQIDVRTSVRDPLLDAEQNIMASINLIDLAVHAKIKKFIFLSSGGAIYGETDARPTTETHPEWPTSPYGIAKLTVDKYLHSAGTIHGLPWISLRCANVYGPRQNTDGEAAVVALFAKSMLSEKNPMITGDGKQTRDFVFVEDVVTAVERGIATDQSGIFNIGTARETTVNELFAIINTLCGEKFAKLYTPARAGELQNSGLSAQKAKKILNWEPAVDIHTGLKKTIAWFSQNRPVRRASTHAQVSERVRV